MPAIRSADLLANTWLPRRSHSRPTRSRLQCGPPRIRRVESVARSAAGAATTRSRMHKDPAVRLWQYSCADSQTNAGIDPRRLEVCKAMERTDSVPRADLLRSDPGTHC